MSIEAMQLALEALTRIWEDGLENFPESGHDAAITALRTAIAEAEKSNIKQVIHLYDEPPAAQRQPLTDEQIERACVPLGAAMLSFTEVARAIEAAHGIKGKNT